MSYVRQNVWRLKTDGRDGRFGTSICVEFFIGGTMGAMKAWVETRHRPTIKDGGGYIDEHVTESDAVYVYGRTIVDGVSEGKKNLDDGTWAAIQMMEALACGEVVGKSAGQFVNSCIWHFIIKGDNDRQKPFREHAPEWWSLITRTF